MNLVLKIAREELKLVYKKEKIGLRLFLKKNSHKNLIVKLIE